MLAHLDQCLFLDVVETGVDGDRGGLVLQPNELVLAVDVVEANEPHGLERTEGAVCFDGFLYEMAVEDPFPADCAGELHRLGIGALPDLDVGCEVADERFEVFMMFARHGGLHPRFRFGRHLHLALVLCDRR